MNILFIFPSTFPYKGGVERVTYLIAQSIRERSVVSFALTEDVDVNQDGVFKDTISLKGLLPGGLLDFIDRNEIDLIVNQLSYDIRIVKLLQRVQFVPLISCFHDSPTFYKDEIKMVLSAKHIPFFSVIKLRAMLKKALLPVYEPYGKAFSISCQLSARFILLSEKFIAPFIKTYHLQRYSNLDYINNPLSLDSFFEEDYSVKQKKVLVVSRLSDMKKRISLILKMWKDIEQKLEAQGWSLIIVGDGGDEKKLKKLANDLKLAHCNFVGPQKDVTDYYRHSSIFLMASTNEGWGLTITEAMQMGCVPIAFDTYLSLQEIISNGQDGFIVPECDTEIFKAAILDLMQNEIRRKNMSYTGIQRSRRFSLKQISNQWCNLFKNVLDAN